jgi:hypothetical protein
MGQVLVGGRVDATTGRTILRHDELKQALVPRTKTVTWTPLAKQIVEPDTLLGPMDTNDEVLIPQSGPGGFIAMGGWTNGTDVAWTSPAVVQAPGKFRRGLATTKRTNGGIYLLDTGLIDPSNFHVEAWWRGTVDWTAFTAVQNLWSLVDHMTLSVNSGANPKITLTYNHSQDPTVASRSYTLSSSVITLGQFPAGADVGIAFSMTPAGVFTLYVNGVQAAQLTGCVPARLFDGQPPNGNGGAGMTLLGAGTLAADQMSMSDLKISRNARVPGVPITVTDANAVTVNPSSTTGTTVNQKLLGVLHRLKGEPAALITNGSPSNPVIRVVRTGKGLNATPTKAGATDATHPTLGQSGLFSYDWTWVDRTVRHIVQDMGCELMLGLEACPQILGGTAAPFSYQQAVSVGAQTPDVSGRLNVTVNTSVFPASGQFAAPNGNVYAYTLRGGTALQGVTLLSGTSGVSFPDGTVVQVGSQYTSQQTFPGTVPNDFTAFGHICADHVYHIVTELGLPPVYCALWNEPDGAFWSGTEAQYLSMYQIVMPMVRAVAPSVKLGGPESTGSNFTILQDLLNTCASSGTPLDFLASHPLGGNLDFIATQTAGIKFASAAAGRATPPDQLLTEYDYSARTQSNSKAIDTTYLYNDWQAAHFARMLIEAQFFGASRFIFTEFQSVWNSFDDSKLIPKSGIPQPTFNVMKLWSMMAPNVISQTVSADPGIAAVASTGSGKTTVFIANIHARKWAEPQTSAPQTVSVTLSGVSDLKPVTCWMIDDERSNQFDAGVANAALQTITVPALFGGRRISR